jgi:hypothetical protein
VIGSSREKARAGEFNRRRGPGVWSALRFTALTRAEREGWRRPSDFWGLCFPTGEGRLVKSQTPQEDGVGVSQIELASRSGGMYVGSRTAQPE